MFEEAGGHAIEKSCPSFLLLRPGLYDMPVKNFRFNVLDHYTYLEQSCFRETMRG